MASSETKVFGSVHEDPNFAVICSFISRYGTLLGLPDISFDALEKWIEDQRYMNDSVKELLLKLMKRWKSSVNEDRLHQYLIKFCHTYSQVDAFEVESCGFQRCKTATKLRIIKSLLEQQFDSNAKFKEKINEVPAWDLRCLPIGRDMTGKAYWFLADREMNIRIYCEEQDDVQNETWHIVVNDRSQLANLITTLEELNGKLEEKSRSATPSTVISESNKSEGDGCQLFPIPEICESSPCAADDAPKIDALELAKPDFTLPSVKSEPPEIADASNEAKKQNLKEEYKDLSAIDAFADDAKTSVEVKAEVAEKIESASAVKIENKTEAVLPLVAEVVAKIEDESGKAKDESRGSKDESRKAEDERRKAEEESRKVEDESRKTENESRKAESLVALCPSLRNSEQQDDNGARTTKAVEVCSEKITCASRESKDSTAEILCETPGEKDLESSVQSNASDGKQIESELTDNVDIGNRTKPESTDNVTARSTDDVAARLTDDAATKPADDVAARSTHDVAARLTDDVVAGSTDDVATTSTDNVATKSTDNVVLTKPTDDVTTKSTDDVAIKSTDNVVSKSTDDVATGSTDNAASKSTDNVAIRSTNDVATRSTDDVATRSTDAVVVEPAVGSESNKLTDSSSSDIKSLTCAPVDLSGVDLSGANGDQVQTTECGERTQTTSADSKARVSVKRKRCEPVQRLSSTEADTARSESSDLSESASELKLRSSGEEPPSKRKRDKALKTVAERDRRAGRVKGQKRSRTPEDQGSKEETGSRNCGETTSGGDSVTNTEIKRRDGDDLPLIDTPEALETKLTDDGAKVLSTATNDEVAPTEAEPTDGSGKPDPDQNKRPVGRTGRKGRKQGRRRKGRREEKENATEKKSDVKPVGRGRGKRGLKPSINQGSEVDYEPNSKVVRPGTKEEDGDESKAASKDSPCVSEDDVPLIELRRSTRSNKGQRKIEPIVTQEPKRRRKNAGIQEEKERKRAELEEKRLRKEAELAALAAKNKKKRRGRNESDDDFVPGKVSARKAKGGRSRTRKRGGGGGGGGGGSEEEESEELEEEFFEPETEEESLRFSASASETELESDGSIYEPRGRNAKRAAAFKENSKPPVEINDQPCSKCGRTDQPEWLLLCDQCECAYHTACLRPPLLAIPEGDWFCPPCEHASLIAKLQEQLSEYDKKAKQNVRLIQRKERLAFVGISLSNILPVQQDRRLLSNCPDLFDDEKDEDEGAATECEQDSEDTEDEDTEEDDRPAQSRNSRRSEQRHETKRSRDNWRRRRRPRQRSPSERSISEEATEDEEEEDDDDDEDGWTSGRRSRRQRKEISYKFEEFDELINEAIEDDVKDAKGAGNFGRGKDMSNITGIRDSDNEDHGPNGKRKKRRRLTHLDSNDEEPDDDDSEEYQLSEGEASSPEEEEEEDTVDADEESDDWQVGRRPTRSQIRLKKGSRRSKRSPKRSSVYKDDFVVDEYDSEDDRPCPRRRRAAAQRQINYQEDSDETDASQNSRPPARKKPARRSGIYSSGSDAEGEEKKRKTTRGRSDDSEYVPSAEEERAGRRGSVATATKKTGCQKRIGSDTDEYNSSRETVSRKKGRMNNYVIESSEEEEEEEEVENSTAHEGEREGEGSDAESRTSEEGGENEQGGPAVPKLEATVASARTVNGHCNASAVNGNTESHNNHNFSIANLLKNSDRRPAPLARSAEFEVPDLLGGGREDSLTDVLDLVDYVTQGDPA